jgi:hypothetical protein
MQSNLFILIAAIILISCNNAAEEKKSESDTVAASTLEDRTAKTSKKNNSQPSANAASISFTIEDTTRNGSASILVTKDKDKLSPGNDYFGMITANLPNQESLVLNFLFDLKPGTYPVVGHSFTRTNQVFGGLLGGKKKITEYKVNLVQVEDMGPNNAGGRRWRVGGTVEEIKIPAMGIMKMDKNHPESIKVNKISFANLGFDDNWEQLVEEGMKKLKK